MYPDRCGGMKNNPELVKALQFFTREKAILEGASVACGSGNRTEEALDGAVREDSVFDLASVTKLFTGLCAMKLKEEGLLQFSRPVFSYDPRFRFLKETTVWDLMTFAVTVRTPVRLDECADRDSATEALFASTAAPHEDVRRIYSDIPAMILKYVLEAAAGMPVMDCVRKLILEPAGMKETWAAVPPERKKDCVCYDLEHRIEKGRQILRQGWLPGVPHDPKAAVMQGDTGDLCGHAGLFSTRGDMVRFCRTVLERKIVGEESLQEMAVNRTGRKRANGAWTQFLGIQCYVRHPDQYYSEIPGYMGQRAFGIGGFTGNHVSMDPERDLFVVFLGNRVLNRLTVLVPEEGKNLADYGLNPDGTGYYRWNDGEVIPSSVQYVHQKDEHLHKAIAEVLGLPAIGFNL